MTSDRLAPDEREGFQAALDRVRLDAGDEVRPTSHCLQALNHVPDLWAQRPYVPLVVARYYEEGDQNSAAAPVIDNATIESVARELDLGSPRSMADLLRLRRAFALRNHPDLVPLEKRARATARMALANFLIDREIRAKTPEHKSAIDSGKSRY
jgi:hypothetical protein